MDTRYKPSKNHRFIIPIYEHHPGSLPLPKTKFKIVHLIRNSRAHIMQLTLIIWTLVLISLFYFLTVETLAAVG